MLRLRNNGNGIGRTVTIEVSDKFISAYTQWKPGTVTTVKAMKLSNMTMVTSYRKVKKYEGK